MAKRSAEERFWEKVDASGDCWEWTASVSGGGYGRFSMGRSSVAAHRWAWEHLVGPIPEGLTLDHLCRNPPCVNPDHLQPVDMRTNTLRGYNPTAKNARKTHCPKGHPLTADNLTPSQRGRVCRTCRLDLKRRRRETETRLCSVDGCERKFKARGVCGTHWYHWRQGRLSI